MTAPTPDRLVDYDGVTFHTDGRVGTVTLNEPETRNAQGYELLSKIELAFDAAAADPDVRVIVIRGAGGHFSSGHRLGHGHNLTDPPLESYAKLKKYNIDLLMKWRDLPKPTIALVEGYCIYGGWMLAAAMDLVFAAEDAQFLGGYVQYNSLPWDLGVRRAKEIAFESRFMTAQECADAGFVSRVYPAQELVARTYGYAQRVAENDPFTLRMTKLEMNKAQDAQGFRSLIADSFGDYVGMLFTPNFEMKTEDGRRLLSVDLAVRGRKGQRPGQSRS